MCIGYINWNAARNDSSIRIYNIDVDYYNIGIHIGTIYVVYIGTTNIAREYETQNVFKLFNRMNNIIIYIIIFIVIDTHTYTIQAPIAAIRSIYFVIVCTPAHIIYIQIMYIIFLSKIFNWRACHTNANPPGLLHGELDIYIIIVFCFKNFFISRMTHHHVGTPFYGLFICVRPHNFECNYNIFNASSRILFHRIHKYKSI